MLIVVTALFLALSVLHLWPLASRLATHSTPNDDTVLSIWWVSEMARQMLRDPVHLFDGNIFYPYSRTLAVIDHMLASSLAALPLWVATENPILVHNATLLATFVLSGTFMALLVRRLCGSWPAGVVAGCAFAFSSFRWYELPHLHVLSTEWLPLALFALDRVIEKPSRGRSAAFATSFLLVALSSWHVAVVGGALIGTVAIWSLVQHPSPTRRQLLAIGGSALLVALVVAPIAVPYTHLAAWRLRQSADQRQRALNRYAVAVDEFLPRQLVLGPPNEPAHGNARARWTFPGIVTWGLACAAFLPHRGSLRRRRVFGGESAAAMLALAMLGLLLAGAFLAALGRTGLMQALIHMPLVVVFVMAFLTWSLFRARRQAFEEHSMDPVVRQGRARLVYATVAALGAIIALGPRASAWGVDLGSGLYRPDVVPLLSVLRTPERFGLLFAFGLAVLSGFGALRLVGLFPLSTRAPLFAAVFVLLNVDLRPAPIDVAEEPGPGPGHEWLRTFPEPGAVVELPGPEWELVLTAGYAHGRRIVNGTGYVFPPGYVRLRGIPEFDPQRFEVLWERFHPRFVLLHGRFYDKRGFERVMRSARSHADALTIVAQPGGDVVFRLKDRGRGSLLHRRWPREALSGTSGLALSAVVGGGRDGRDDRLVISLNDRLLYELEGAALREGALRHVPFQSEWLVPGENRFDILADYRYGAGQAPNAIGQTGVSVAADLHARADGSGAWYQVNGDRREVPPGYTLLAIDPATGRVLTRGLFDTARREADSAALARFVDALAPATPVLVVSEGDVSARLTGEAVAALHALGLREDLRSRRRWVHAAIGVKGAPGGTAIERVHRADAAVTVGTPETRHVQLDGLELY